MQFLFNSEIWGFLSASERRNTILPTLVSLHVHALLNEETDAHSFDLELILYLNIEISMNAKVRYNCLMTLITIGKFK